MTSWAEKINKTIAMITASPDYQLYIKRRRARAQKVRLGGQYFINSFFERDSLRDCISCGERASKPRSNERCTKCRHALIMEAWAAGRSAQEISEIVGNTYTAVCSILRNQRRTAFSKPRIGKQLVEAGK